MSTLCESNMSPVACMRVYDIGAGEDPSCPLRGHERHDAAHVLECREMPTDLAPLHLWRSPAESADLLELWKTALGDAEDQEPAVRQ